MQIDFMQPHKFRILVFENETDSHLLLIIFARLNRAVDFEFFGDHAIAVTKRDVPIFTSLAEKINVPVKSMILSRAEQCVHFTKPPDTWPPTKEDAERLCDALDESIKMTDEVARRADAIMADPTIVL